MGAASTTMPQCPSCGSEQCSVVGRVPDAIVFAGKYLSRALAGVDLACCSSCGLRFKFPPLEKALLDRLYLDASGETWQGAAELRVDWQLAAKHLGAGKGRSLLDLGCFDGRFLGTVDVGWIRHGIEISDWGAHEAALKGVSVIGRDFDVLRSHPERFDAITAFDVIEHVHSPDLLLAECWKALRPGGTLIVATGDASSLPWRLHRQKNLYCICPEHLVFLTPAWVSIAATRHRFRLLILQRYRRDQSSVLAIVRDFISNALFALSPSLVEALVRGGIGRPRTSITREHPPLWPSALDHMIFVLRKDPQ